MSDFNWRDQADSDLLRSKNMTAHSKMYTNKSKKALTIRLSIFLVLLVPLTLVVSILLFNNLNMRRLIADYSKEVSHSSQLLVKKNQALSDKIGEKNESIEVLEEAIRNYEAKDKLYKTAATNLEEAKENIQSLSDSNRELTSLLEAEKGKVSSLNSNLQGAEENIQSLSDSNRELTSLLEEVEGKVSNLNSNIEKLQLKVCKLEKELDIQWRKSSFCK